MIMEQAELGLEEALLSNDNRNKFFHHSGSGKGSDILGGKKIIPSVNLPNSPVRNTELTSFPNAELVSQKGKYITQGSMVKE